MQNHDMGGAASNLEEKWDRDKYVCYALFEILVKNIDPSTIFEIALTIFKFSLKLKLTKNLPLIENQFILL